MDRLLIIQNLSSPTTHSVEVVTPGIAFPLTKESQGYLLVTNLTPAQINNRTEHPILFKSDAAVLAWAKKLSRASGLHNRPLRVDSPVAQPLSGPGGTTEVAAGDGKTDTTNCEPNPITIAVDKRSLPSLAVPGNYHCSTCDSVSTFTTPCKCHG